MISDARARPQEDDAVTTASSPDETPETVSDGDGPDDAAAETEPEGRPPARELRGGDDAGAARRRRGRRCPWCRCSPCCWSCSSPARASSGSPGPGRRRSAPTTTSDALQAARSGVVDMTSFDYLTLDDDIKQIEAVTTGDLKKEAVDQLNSRRQQITDTQATVNTEVVGAGVTRADRDSATVLLVIQSTQKSSASEQAQVVRYRIQVETAEEGRPLAALRHRGDRDGRQWLTPPTTAPPRTGPARRRGRGRPALPAPRRGPASPAAGGSARRAAAAAGRPADRRDGPAGGTRRGRTARPPRRRRRRGAGTARRRPPAAATRPPAAGTGAGPGPRAAVRARGAPAAGCCSGSGSTRAYVDPTIFSSARSGVQALYAYDYKDSDGSVRRKLDVLTGDLRDQYKKDLGQGGIIDTYKQVSATTSYQVLDVGLQQVNDAQDTATVVVFGEYVVKSVNTGEQAAPEGSECTVTAEGAQSCTQTVQMRMIKVDGDWKINELTLLTTS